MAEDGLTDRYAITDVDGDGVYEVLIHTGAYGGGQYEMRLLDGRRFTSPTRVLYRWID